MIICITSLATMDPPEEPDYGIQLAEGYKIVDFGTTSTYIGHVDSQNRPHGHGYMVFAPVPGSDQRGYDLHEGEFFEGRAHGPGVFLGRSGEQCEGEWKENRRVGIFQSIKPNGVKFKEKYGEDGKLKARKKQEDAPEPPLECWNCHGLYREAFNNAFACRRHRGEWRAKNRFDEESAGVWSCCVHETYTHPGCEFTSHNLNH